MINEGVIRIKELMGLKENIEPENGYQLYFHGGDLESIDTYTPSYKNGKIVYGIGLYLTTSRTVADKYAKGRRKLYVVKVSDNIKTYNNIDISKEVVSQVFTKFLSKIKHKLLLNFLERINPLDVVNAHNLNVFLLNENLISKQNIEGITNFFIYQGVEGDIEISPFGYGEKQLVLLDNKKIKSIERIAPNDSKYYEDFKYNR